jgi:biotin carboxyl carrier protein
MVMSRKMPPERTTYRVGEVDIPIEYRARRDGTFRLELMAGTKGQRTVAVFAAGAGAVDLEIDGRRLQMAVTSHGERWLVHGPSWDVEIEELPRLPVPGAAEIKGGLTAPMPGNVLATHVGLGDDVRAGQLLLVLEAMKMQHRITAPFDGTVAEVHVSAGDQVDNGALLVMIEEDEDAADG